MIVYLGADYQKAVEILRGDWSRTPTFLYKNLEHAVKRAIKMTPKDETPVVIELHYKNPRKLSYNPHKHGYHTSIKPSRARIKWISVNGGYLLYNYQGNL